MKQLPAEAASVDVSSCGMAIRSEEERECCPGSCCSCNMLLSRIMQYQTQRDFSRRKICMDSTKEVETFSRTRDR